MAENYTGLVSVFSTVHPLRSLSEIVRRPIPVDFSHCATVLRSPLKAMKRLFDRLFCCSSILAHTQFSFEYPISLFKRSMVRLFGHSPMSDKNLSNVSHSSQTVIPLPPYRRYAGMFLLRHLFLIPCHMLCVRVLLNPWRLLRLTTSSAARSLAKQPHDFDTPVLKDCDCTSVSFPQSHKHLNRTCFLLPFGARSMTVNLSNFRPVRSMKFGISNVYHSQFVSERNIY